MSTHTGPATYIVGTETSWSDISAYSPLDVDELRELNPGVNLSPGVELKLH